MLLRCNINPARLSRSSSGHLDAWAQQFRDCLEHVGAIQASYLAYNAKLAGRKAACAAMLAERRAQLAELEARIAAKSVELAAERQRQRELNESGFLRKLRGIFQ